MTKPHMGVTGSVFIACVKTVKTAFKAGRMGCGGQGPGRRGPDLSLGRGLSLGRDFLRQIGLYFADAWCSASHEVPC